MVDRPIDRDELLRMASLAQLELDEPEIVRMTGELSAILAYVRQLQAVPIDGVPATAHVLLERLPLRADEPEDSLPRKELLGQAPEQRAGGFAVPVFVDDGRNGGS